MISTQQISERALGQLENGVKPSQLDLCKLTDLTPKELVAVQNYGQGNALRLLWPDADQWTRGGFVNSHHANVRGAGSRKAVSGMLSPICQAYGLVGYLEMSEYPIQNSPLLTATTGMLAVFVPTQDWQMVFLANQECEKVDVLDGKYEYLSQATRDKIITLDGWTGFSIEGFDRPIGAYNKDRGEVFLFINLSATKTWSGWSKTKRSELSEPKIWELIISAALPNLPTVQHAKTSVKVTPHMLTAYQTALHWQRLQLDTLDPLDQLRGQYDLRRQKAIQVRDQSRQALQDVQKQVQDLRKELEVQRKNKETHLQQALTVATVAVRQVGMLHAVKSVQATEIDGLHGLRVQLFDVSIKDQDMGDHYLVPGLEFSTAFTHDGYRLIFHGENRQVYGKMKCLHPHLFYHGKEPCFGEAAMTMAAAAKLRNIVLMVGSIIRWAAHCKQSDHYIHDLRHFPPTHLPAGYVIPKGPA